MGLRRRVTVLALGVSSFVPSVAVAQSSSDRALAEALYDEGRRLMAEGKHAEACPKLDESQRLDPATGTLLNLAACREQEGRLATAWLLFKDGSAAARRDGRQDRVDYAEAKVKELSPRVSRLTLAVATEAAAEGLEVRLDGQVIRPVAWGIATAVDGGVHVVEATAPGRTPFRAEVRVAQEGDHQRVAVPALPPATDAAVAPPSPGGEAAPVAVAAPDAAGDTNGVGAARGGSGGGLGAGVYVAGAFTVGLTVGALITGVSALKRADEFNAANRDPDRTVWDREQLREDAMNMQVANTVLTGTALVGAGLTTVLIVTRPRARASTSAWRASPWIGVDGGGVVVGGAL